MCELISTLNCPEFISLINQYDVICIQESKLDDADAISVAGYHIFTNNRMAISRYRSGCITLIVKDEFSPYIHILYIVVFTFKALNVL